jgi:uncharacterized protein (DUF2141 family)
MEILDITRIIHIFAGFTAFFAAPIALIMKKGGASHIKFGKAFVWAMGIATATAFINSLFIWIPFLLMLSVFSFYNVLIGVRAIRFYRGEEPSTLDNVIHLVALLFAAALFGYGIYGYATTPQNFVWILSVVFGALGMFGISKNYRMIRKEHDRATWMRFHISGMLSGYIAAVTAFSATSLDFLPGLVQWLWPTVLFTPMIAWHQRRVKKTVLVGAAGLLLFIPGTLLAGNPDLSPCLTGDCTIPAKKGTLTITVTSAKNGGVVYLRVMNAENEKVGECLGEVVDGQMTCKVDGLTPGQYAVAAFQDLNGDEEMNANMFGMPTEPYGFSNNARGNFGPPSFDDQLFEMDGDKSIAFKVK